MPFSSRILRADGLAALRQQPGGGSQSGGRAGAAAAAGTGGGLGFGVDGGDHFAGGHGIATVLDQFDQHAVGRSRVSSTTLSVSMSIRFSSRLTASPSFLCQVTSVASETDSDSCGTLTSIRHILSLGFSWALLGHQAFDFAKCVSMTAFCCALCLA